MINQIYNLSVRSFLFGLFVRSRKYHKQIIILNDFPHNQHCFGLEAYHKENGVMSSL